MLRFGISIDLDVLDPLEESDFGSPESGGRALKNILVDMLSTLKIKPNFLAMKNVEDNPYLAAQFVTASHFNS